MKNVLRSYNFHGLFRLNIFREFTTPLDSYLENLFAHFEVQSTDDADLTVRIEKFPKDFPGCCHIDGKYTVRENFVMYENAYKGARWRVAVEGLDSDAQTVRVDANLLARPVLAGETLFSYIRYHLARKKCALLHAAGIGVNGEGVIFAGRSGVGKTITAIKALRRGALFYGDDTVILGADRKIYSFILPLNLRFSYDVERVLGVRFGVEKKIEILLKKILAKATFNRYQLFTTLPVKKVFPKMMGDSVPLRATFLIFQGAVFALEAEEFREQFLSQIVQTVRFESSELSGVLEAYAQVFPASFPAKFWAVFRETVDQALVGSPFFRVSIPKLYEDAYFESLWRQVNRCESLTTTFTI